MVAHELLELIVRVRILVEEIAGQQTPAVEILREGLVASDRHWYSESE